ncbi:MAG: hypothetical protein SOW94_04035 [Erysipelotrichaceae bacterium]|nr:hypothetical protein [Erysipelotrichaceae bacterium]
MRYFQKGCEQRALLGYCAESILNRQGRNMEIESWFEEGRLDVMFYDVLLFIMDSSLSSRDGTPLEEIAAFLAEDCRMYGHELSGAQIHSLADYMVRDILQNNGRILQYPIYDTEKQVWQDHTVRLIEDSIQDGIIFYRLTEQGYDFLLRTREVDAEYDGWVSMLIMQRKLEHRNFRESKDQCRQCLNILRREEQRFLDFTMRVRQDVASIGRKEYSKMISSYYENLDEEKKLTDETINLVEKFRAELSRNLQNHFHADEETAQNLSYLSEMADMLAIITGEEGKLLEQRYSISSLYQEMLEDNLTISPTRRYDFGKEVIDPFAKISGNAMAAGYRRLIRPLYEPEAEKVFDLLMLYRPEKKFREEDRSDLILDTEETYDSSDEKEEIEAISERYAKVFSRLLDYCALHPEGFAVSEFISWYEEELQEDYPGNRNDKSCFLMFLNLYAMGIVRLEVDPESNEVPDKDFSLNETLRRLQEQDPEFHGIRSLSVSSEDGEDLFEFYDPDADEPKQIYGMSRIRIIPEIERNLHYDRRQK